MVKPVFILVLSLSIFETAFAQKDTSYYYLQSSGKLVSTKDSADFYIEILPSGTPSHKDLYVVNGYYLDGRSLFKTASLTRSFPLKLQGSYTTFFSGGSKRLIRNYDHGELTGDIIEYYPNGRFYYKQSYLTTLDTTELQYVDCSDSTGKVLAANGNGDWVTYNEDFTRIIEKGKVKDGRQDSTWQVSQGNEDFYSVRYKNGKVVGGDPGNRKTFTSVEQVPEFPGGIEAFGRYLSLNIRYPEAARKNNTSGRVIVSFVVERDGSLTNVKVVRGIGDGCDEEAVRVIRSSPKWRPGRQNSRPVRVQYSVPINFGSN